MILAIMKAVLALLWLFIGLTSDNEVYSVGGILLLSLARLELEIAGGK